ncbi:MAG: hypothetical protein M3O22_03455 [Pseudomonadota bacterium]|nr:hypothetical protein [Pseudomonadota bacterium]
MKKERFLEFLGFSGIAALPLIFGSIVTGSCPGSSPAPVDCDDLGKKVGKVLGMKDGKAMISRGQVVSGPGKSPVTEFQVRYVTGEPMGIIQNSKNNLYWTPKLWPGSEHSFFIGKVDASNPVVTYIDSCATP